MVSPDRLFDCAYAERGPFMHILKFIRQELLGVLLGIDPTYVCWKILSPPPTSVIPITKKPTLLHVDGQCNSCNVLKTYVFFSQSSLVLARSGCSVRVTHFHLLVISHSKTIQQRRNCFHSIHPCNSNKLTFVFVLNTRQTFNSTQIELTIYLKYKYRKGAEKCIWK